MWIRRFILFHGTRHPSAMGAEEVNAFLSHLAVEQTVSASTQNQALATLLFLYRNVLAEPLPWIDDIVRAQRPLRLPVVLTTDEVRRVIEEVSPPVARLVVRLLYGSGLRLLAALMLRAKDRAGCKPRQARNVSYVPSLLRDTPSGAGPRHPHGAGAPRPPRRLHDDDLHPRPAPRRPRRAQSTGCVITSRVGLA
ncbi:MAG: integron integrase [Acidobacteria bacterium]|nr:integron integrase [Acidobacteriota bacterium]